MDGWVAKLINGIVSILRQWLSTTGGILIFVGFLFGVGAGIYHYYDPAFWMFDASMGAFGALLILLGAWFSWVRAAKQGELERIRLEREEA